MDVELKTARLTLRPQVRDDTPAIITGLNDWEVVRWLTLVPYPYSQADAEEWLARQVPPEPGHAHFAIDGGAGLIGVVTLDAELGYWLAREHHGHGYMTEACAALLDWHFAARPDDVVPSGYHVGNAASAAVQRKLGFVETGSRLVKFSRAQKRDIEVVGTTLTRAQFDAAHAGGR